MAKAASRILWKETGTLSHTPCLPGHMRKLLPEIEMKIPLRAHWTIPNQAEKSMRSGIPSATVPFDLQVGSASDHAISVCKGTRGHRLKSWFAIVVVVLQAGSF